MANNPFYVEPANPLQALMVGDQAYQGAVKERKQNEQETAFKDAAAEYQGAGKLSPSTLSRLIGIGPPAAPIIKAFADLEQSRTSANSVYGTPIYGVDEKGNTKIGSFNKQGTFVPVNTPGFTPSPGIRTIDTGTGTQIINARTAVPMGGVPQGAPQQGVPQQGGPPQQGVSPDQPPQVPVQLSPQARGPVGYIPKDVAGAARAKEQGKEEGAKLSNFGQAKAGLDAVNTNLDRLEKDTTRLLNHPGLAGITSIPGALPNIPGGQAANAEALLKSLKAKGGFMALQAMRDASKTGGALGSVSDQEGVRLENSFAVLDKAQSVDEFKRGLQDVIQISREIRMRAQGAFRQDYERLKSGGQQPVGYQDYFRGQ